MTLALADNYRLQRTTIRELSGRIFILKQYESQSRSNNYHAALHRQFGSGPWSDAIVQPATFLRSL
jgi:hypothetical protein